MDTEIQDNKFVLNFTSLDRVFIAIFILLLLLLVYMIGYNLGLSTSLNVIQLTFLNNANQQIDLPFVLNVTSDFNGKPVPSIN